MCMFYTAIIFKILKGSLNLGFICQRYVFIKKLTKLVVVVNLFKFKVGLEILGTEFV